MSSNIKNNSIMVTPNNLKNYQTSSPATLKNWKVIATDKRGHLFYNEKRGLFEKQIYSNWFMMALKTIFVSPIKYMYGFSSNENVVCSGMDSLLAKTVKDYKKAKESDKKALINTMEVVHDYFLEKLAQQYKKKKEFCKEVAIRKIQEDIKNFITIVSKDEKKKQTKDTNDKLTKNVDQNINNDSKREKTAAKQNDNDNTPSPAGSSPVPANGPPVPANGPPAPSNGPPVPANGPPAPSNGPPVPTMQNTLNPAEIKRLREEKKQKRIAETKAQIDAMTKVIEDIEKNLSKIKKRMIQNQAERRKIHSTVEKGEALRKTDFSLKEYHRCRENKQSCEKALNNLKEKKVTLKKSLKHLEEQFSKVDKGSNAKVTVLLRGNLVPIDFAKAETLKKEIIKALDEEKENELKLLKSLKKAKRNLNKAAKVPVSNKPDISCGNFLKKLNKLKAKFAKIKKRQVELEKEKETLLKENAKTKKDLNIKKMNLARDEGSEFQLKKERVQKSAQEQQGDLAKACKQKVIAILQEKPTVEDIIQSFAE